VKSRLTNSASMKSLRIVVSLLLLAAAAVAQTTAQRSFDQLKSLAGSWEGKNSHGTHLTVTFRDTAGGSALLSEVNGHGRENMVTIFYLDGPSHLMLTHFSAAGNQPRMTGSTSADGKTITFEFRDATGLKDPEAGHMAGVSFTIIDANHHTERWTFADHGNETSNVFDLHR
jgi:hypothetical protein